MCVSNKRNTFVVVAIRAIFLFVKNLDIKCSLMEDIPRDPNIDKDKVKKPVELGIIECW